MSPLIPISSSCISQHEEKRIEICGSDSQWWIACLQISLSASIR